MDPPYDYRSIPQDPENVQLREETKSAESVEQCPQSDARRMLWRNRLKHRVRDVLIVAALSLTAFLVLFSIAFMLNSPTNNFSFEQNQNEMKSTSVEASGIAHAERHCGHNEASATQLGCRFDLISYSWTPRQCWDEELYDDFMSRYNTSLSFDMLGRCASSIESVPESGTTNLDPVSTSPENCRELPVGSSEVVMSWKTHLVACTYAWQKLTRAALRQQPLDTWSASYSRAETCGRHLVTRGKFGWDDMVVTKQVGYTRCGLDEIGMLSMLVE